MNFIAFLFFKKYLLIFIACICVFCLHVSVYHIQYQQRSEGGVSSHEVTDNYGLPHGC